MPVRPVLLVVLGQVCTSDRLDRSDQVARYIIRPFHDLDRSGKMNSWSV